MIMHVVLIKFNPDITPVDIDQLEGKLFHLQNSIPEVISFNVGRNIISSERAFDFGVVGTFKDLNALNRYQVHTEHNRIKEFLKPMCAQIISVDFTYNP